MTGVSLVVTNWNGKDLLAKHLSAVVAACRAWRKTGWEIIVADDHSKDGSREFLREHFPEVKFVSTPARQYFAQTCNLGVTTAQGDIIVLLNNDVSPREDFLSPLIKNFDDPLVFAVGCKELDTRGSKKTWSGRGLMKFERGLVVHRRAEDQNRKATDWVTAGSAAYDRRKWLEIGGMDPLFRPAYEEDRDISYRALKHGWKVLFEPASVVEHRHETTNLRAFGARRIKIISFKNQFLFVWKNITDKKYLFWHFFWLPYHLTLTAARTKGLLWLGFLRALSQLPEAVVQRQKIKKLFTRTDEELV